MRISISFLRCSIFSFVSNLFVNVCWSIFNDSYFKVLSYNRIVYVILLLPSVVSFFSCKLRCSWLLGIMSDFQLYPGHFGYYVSRLHILFKSFVLAGFLWCHTHGARRTTSLPPVGDRSPVSADTLVGEEHLITLGGGESSGSPQTSANTTLVVKWSRTFFLLLTWPLLTQCGGCGRLYRYAR